MTRISFYSDTSSIDSAVAAGDHRTIVGGLWDEIGALQLDTLVAHGLKPHHRLLDVGCGALRGGVHFVRYLESAHYYGLDINQSLLDAGYNLELSAAGLQDRLPRSHLAVDAQFDATGFGVPFDRAMAFSLFTHLPLDLIRICLERVADVMTPGGIFHATYFEAPEHRPTRLPIQHAPTGLTTYAGSDPYHQRLSDFVHLADGLAWDVVYAGDFGHPRGQKLVSFVRRPRTSAQPSETTRTLGLDAARSLLAGAEHYRAFVGPPERYDLIGASQFALLFQLGLRDHHKVLDFGCGSLRLGRLLIPFLQPGRYHGLDPNDWLIDDGFTRELGHSALAVKHPRFSNNSDFDCGVFGTKFDFVIAQSIVTHTGPDLLARLLQSASKVMTDTGIFIFSCIETPQRQVIPPPGWHYPHCVGYDEAQLRDALSAAGLHGVRLPWFHPGAVWWLAKRRESALPNPSFLESLTGRVLGVSP
ncbi:hypothetical protein RHODGE_RHODGE_04122 [Rhodoplanes serenus]|uniref:Methyltransferase type 12 domain-containing protein n=2 Tax=Rhodoplanes TaxID=29407 RepID=A0A3S4FFD6_9BRAD|nr:methyltransferase [Rhodoplanes serenus]VCU10918.1 hypothetical protein RHODGE_RHODGE_04122 [Rhodoplanes serenus]